VQRSSSSSSSSSSSWCKEICYAKKKSKLLSIYEYALNYLVSPYEKKGGGRRWALSIFFLHPLESFCPKTTQVLLHLSFSLQ
jgi:hypothetical protein